MSVSLFDHKGRTALMSGAGQGIGSLGRAGERIVGRAAPDGPAGCGGWPPVGAAGPVFCGLPLAARCTASAVACPWSVGPDGSRSLCPCRPSLAVRRAAGEVAT
jgi:hypothetical protein